MIVVKTTAAFVLTLLLLTGPAFVAGAATVVPTGPEDGHAGVRAQLLHWLDAGLDRVLAGLGGFGGTGDDGMGSTRTVAVAGTVATPAIRRRTAGTTRRRAVPPVPDPAVPTHCAIRTTR